MHPDDAEVRGIRDGDWVTPAGKVGTTSLHAVISDRMPVGVVHTTFHHSVTGAPRMRAELRHRAESVDAPPTVRR